MRIELFGIARVRAGKSKVEVDADSSAAALRALGRACPGLEPDVVSSGRLTRHFIASINGGAFLRADEDRALEPEDTLVIIGHEVGG